ncbi:MAG TPA: hypothetical protein VMS64_24210 [Candidatus Methylomirabilis sp.]|nr:hypothetical protein [Candidatus Methylomirabilis sp.]
MKAIVVALVIAVVVPGAALGADPAEAPTVAQAKTDQGTAPSPGAAANQGASPKMQEARLVTVRGTVEAIDKDKQTVTLKGPKRSLTLHVRDPKKLDAIKVGDPVVGKYYESLMIEVKKPGEATPGVTAQQAVATSKPGETPAGVVGERVTVTATIVGIDKKAHTATIKGPEGNTVTVKARDPKNLDKVKVGDNVEITYTEALAISIDKPVKK